MVKVFFRVTVPDELLQALFQTVRDFDTKHDPGHEGKVQFEMLTEAEWPSEKMREVMQAVSPGFKFNYSVPKPDKEQP